MKHNALSTALAFILTLAVAMPVVAATSSGGAPQTETVSLTPSSNAEGLGMFDGELTLEHMGRKTTQVTVTIRNLMSPTDGGYITGIGLNNPYDQISSVRLTASNENFQVIGDKRPYNAVKALPYGLFDFGAAVGGDFNLNKEYQLGLPPDMGGTVHTFVFNITGDDLDILTTQDFLNESSKRRGGEQIASFVVKFKGINGKNEQTVALNII